MYICICNKVTERDIEAILSTGNKTLDDVMKCTKLANNCGKCLEEAEKIIQILNKKYSNIS
jgi:bacterioferritin-associated ferredoxin